MWGWTNAQTWNVHLWITNDPYHLRMCRKPDTPNNLRAHFRALQAEDPMWAQEVTAEDIDAVNWQEIYEAIKETT